MPVVWLLTPTKSWYSIARHRQIPGNPHLTSVEHDSPDHPEASPHIRAEPLTAHLVQSKDARSLRSLLHNRPWRPCRPQRGPPDQLGTQRECNKVSSHLSRSNPKLQKTLPPFSLTSLTVSLAHLSHPREPNPFRQRLNDRKLRSRDLPTSLNIGHTSDSPERRQQIREQELDLNYYREFLDELFAVMRDAHSDSVARLVSLIRAGASNGEIHAALQRAQNGS
ncbi:hypothetical protein PCH_Pc22g08850 [Penicillium rubens Wisconsin 54-1255]|jgi:hypothetical protein|uniref:Uncharacterized protein n=1 Tax=Penicillium rubens (strain ATCC 28089 / DSM 1075 / NRRL 1951 / Wisconsin 54-1255) TaxID=500485 RepID=B6HT44_PENRW|nr:hypothetical protein PCH_Pc22g08850 [Penicillium rubens Wisconsin 54-1255]